MPVPAHVLVDSPPKMEYRGTFLTPYGRNVQLLKKSGILMSVSRKKPSASVRREDVNWNIETEREDDGRWIAEIAAVPGVIVYGTTEDEAKRKAYALALRVIADDVENSKNVPRSIKLDCASA